MRNIITTFCAAALSVSVLAGCAGVAHIEKDQSVDLASFRTFAWAETREKTNDTVQPKVSDLTGRMIKQSVSEELVKNGWRESSKPDVLLTYDILVEKSLREENNPMYSQPFSRLYFNPWSRRWMSLYYPMQFFGYDRIQRQVNEGTITISLIDAKTDKTIWQGWTTDEVKSKNLTGKEIRNSIRTIFRKFEVAKN